MRRILAAVGVVAAALLLSSCLLLNRAPISLFASSVLNGTSPLTVTFDAEDSYDPDGSIMTYQWDFGDGNTDSGAEVSHTFTAASVHTFTVTLVVTDNDGATGTSTQTIEVHPAASGTGAGNNAPTARFTVSPSYGDSPLTVTFDASLSSDVDGEIVLYGWDFGDGSTGSGESLTHEFTSVVTTNYTVTLTVTDDDGATASTSITITVMVADTVPTERPTAEFTVGDPVQVYESTDLPSVPSLFEVEFDPQGSRAPSGHTLKIFAWNFGDGETLTLTSDAIVTHTYASAAASHTYVVTLTVTDSQGLSDSAVRNVTVVN